MEGGTVDLYPFSRDLSHMYLIGGTVGFLDIYDSSRVQITGAQVLDYTSVHETSHLLVSGGKRSTLYVYQEAEVTFLARSLFLGPGLACEEGEIQGTRVLSGTWKTGHHGQ